MFGKEKVGPSRQKGTRGQRLRTRDFSRMQQPSEKEVLDQSDPTLRPSGLSIRAVLRLTKAITHVAHFEPPALYDTQGYSLVFRDNQTFNPLTDKLFGLD